MREPPDVHVWRLGTSMMSGAICMFLGATIGARVAGFGLALGLAVLAVLATAGVARVLKNAVVWVAFSFVSMVGLFLLSWKIGSGVVGEMWGVIAGLVMAAVAIGLILLELFHKPTPMVVADPSFLSTQPVFWIDTAEVNLTDDLLQVRSIKVCLAVLNPGVPVTLTNNRFTWDISLPRWSEGAEAGFSPGGESSPTLVDPKGDIRVTKDWRPVSAILVPTDLQRREKFLQELASDAKDQKRIEIAVRWQADMLRDGVNGQSSFDSRVHMRGVVRKPERGDVYPDEGKTASKLGP